MLVKTKYFGDVESNENEVILFEDGVPGFEDFKKYIIINDDDKFFWLQSVENSEVAFIMMDVFDYFPDYNPIVETDSLISLGKPVEDELLIYNIAVIPNDIKKLSVNLKAPIVINTKTNKGKQIIVNNEEYSIKHYLYENIHKEDL